MSIRLRELIRAVRQCKTAAEERAVIQKESAALRTAFREQDTLYRHRNLAKLMYIHMLGYPTHFGQMETLKLIAANGFPEKRIGYLGLMILLDERQEVLMLVTNSLKQDLASKNQYIVGLALCALGNIGSAEMSRDLAPEVERLLASSNPYIRKKAALCCTRVIQKVPEVIESVVDKATALLKERHHGALLAGITLMLAITEVEPSSIELYRQEVPTLCKVLRSLLLSGYAQEHDVGGITDPFLQVKILRLLRILGKGNAEASDQMGDVLAQVATNIEGSRNAGNAILYECVTTVMGTESLGGLRVLAINILGRFLANRDNNIRYVALNTLAQVVAVDTQAVQRHRATVVDCVKDADLSIRRRALDLVYSLVNEGNIRLLTKELLDYLKVTDADFKPDLTAKICQLVQRFAPDRQWQLDSFLEVMVEAGAYVKEEVVRAVVVLVTNTPELHTYAVRSMYRALKDNLSTAASSLVICAAWFIGEYGELLAGGTQGGQGASLPPASSSEAVSLLESALQAGQGGLVGREYCITALMKLSARFPDLTPRIKGLIEQYRQNPQLELQTRSCEYAHLFQFDQIRGQLLEHMPAVDEAVYNRVVAGASAADASAPAPATANGSASSLVGDLLSLDDGLSSAPPSAQVSTAADLLQDLLGGDLLPAPPAGAGAGTAAPPAAAAPLDLLNLLGDLGAPAPAPPSAAPAAGFTGRGVSGVPAPLPEDLFAGPVSAAAPPPAAPAFPSIPVFNMDGITITFAFSKPAGNPQVTDIEATFVNAGLAPVTDFSLQAAVPKFMQLRLEPATGSTLAAGGASPVTQRLHVTNTMYGQKALVLRLRVGYTLNGTPKTEQVEVKNLPPGL